MTRGARRPKLGAAAALGRRGGVDGSRLESTWRVAYPRQPQMDAMFFTGSGVKAYAEVLLELIVGEGLTAPPRSRLSIVWSTRPSATS